jgi:hypothetical protein
LPTRCPFRCLSPYVDTSAGNLLLSPHVDRRAALRPESHVEGLFMVWLMKEVP